jgi:putative cardiolipin synthase
LLDGVLQAADRGVRVRILIDDLNAFALPEARKTLTALDGHRNIEVRLFNPFAYRGSVPLLQRVEFRLDARRLNHRMHNKLLAADSSIAIVGGRNVADDYFNTGAVSVRFGDFDVAVVGAVVPDLEVELRRLLELRLGYSAGSAVSRATCPHRARGADGTHGESRRSSGGHAPRRFRRSAGRIARWTRSADLGAGDRDRRPSGKGGRALVRRRNSPTATTIDSLVDGVSHDLILISPYFIPGPDRRSSLEGLLQRGARVRILTNSLASTDVPAVHGAYRRYRKALIDAGAEVFEVRPVPGTRASDRETRIGSGSSSGGGSAGGSGASGAPFALHAKAYVFDERKVLIGSANLDPRSLELNTEIGLLIDSPEIARDVIRRFDGFASSARSYRVVLAPESSPRAMEWHTEVDGQPVFWSHEPDTTLWQRIKAGPVHAAHPARETILRSAARFSRCDSCAVTSGVAAGRRDSHRSSIFSASVDGMRTPDERYSPPEARVGRDGQVVVGDERQQVQRLEAQRQPLLGCALGRLFRSPMQGRHRRGERVTRRRRGPSAARLRE